MYHGGSQEVWKVHVHGGYTVMQDSVTAFQTSFFSFLSLVFAIYSGNTMAFLYEVRKPSCIT